MFATNLTLTLYATYIQYYCIYLPLVSNILHNIPTTVTTLPLHLSPSIYVVSSVAVSYISHSVDNSLKYPNNWNLLSPSNCCLLCYCYYRICLCLEIFLFYVPIFLWLLSHLWMYLLCLSVDISSHNCNLSLPSPPLCAISSVDLPTVSVCRHFYPQLQPLPPLSPSVCYFLCGFTYCLCL